MGLSYDIGDRVMQIEDKVTGKVIDMYYPTACKQQTMILCDDGRKYHAPSDTFTKISELEEQIAKTIKERPTQIAIEAGLQAGQTASQPLLLPHNYRNIKVADGMTITIDVEEIKRQLEKSHYPEIGLNYGA